VKWLRAWWNWHYDLPKVRGGNWALIPLEVRDTQHPSYPAWASFVNICNRNTGILMGPRGTLVAWSGYLQAWRYHQNLDDEG
jgi:hypothetical protein